VALPFQKVGITNRKAVTLIHLPNGTVTEGVKARVLMLFAVCSVAKQMASSMGPGG